MRYLSLISCFQSPALRNAGLFFGLFLGCIASAAIAQKPTVDAQWLSLLHVQGSKPEIISEGFYLSAKPFDPAQELLATLDYLKHPMMTVVGQNKTRLCQYPARYLYLQNKGWLDLKYDPFIHCPAFAEWSKAETLHSVSLLFVTGYLSNPASTFGHVLLKINNQEGENTRGVLNKAVNYGAIVPDEENGVLYALYGLFGGYKAAFTSKKLYEQNHIYLDRELRDIWEYELDLEQKQLRLLVAHIWELFENRFDYYFIDENCTYHMARLLELVLQEPLGMEKSLWNMPVELFDIISAREDLVKTVELIPSRQRELIAMFKNLSAEEQGSVRNILEDSHNDNALLSNASIKVADFFVRYYQYKSLFDTDHQTEHEKNKNLWLQRRLKMPVALGLYESMSYSVAPPTDGHRPAVISLSARDDHVEEFILGFAVSSHDLLSSQLGWIEDSQFTAIEFSLIVDPERIDLEKFTFFEIDKFKNSQTNVVGDSVFSWGLSLGYQSDDVEPEFHGAIAKARYGYSVRFDESMLYSLIEWGIAEHLSAESFGLGSLQVGWLQTLGPKTRNLVRLEWLDLEHQAAYHWSNELSYSIKKDQQFRTKLANGANNDHSFSLRWLQYW